MHLNNLHKLWIQNKIDIIDWIAVIAIVAFAIFAATKLNAAGNTMQDQQKQIEQMQKSLDKQKHSAVLCQSLKNDRKIKLIMGAR